MGLAVSSVFSVVACSLLTPLDGFSEADGAAPDAAASTDAPVPSIDTGVDADVTPVDGGDAGLFSSCNEALARSPQTPTGKRTIAFGGRVASVWCEMTAFGGGWTLVGRSAAGTGLFGWRQRVGSVDDDANPYSLDATGLSFTQVLLGNYESGKVLGDIVYRFDAPPNHVEANQTRSVLIKPSLVVLRGSCTTDNSIMLHRVGYTAQPEVFWFRDTEAFSQGYGLQAQGFELNYGDCYGGNLHKKQGLIFVR